MMFIGLLLFAQITDFFIVFSTEISTRLTSKDQQIEIIIKTVLCCFAREQWKSYEAVCNASKS
jgi:hypothetical protein